MTESLSIIQVALPVPLYRHFDYQSPQPLPPIGSRVFVPFGKQQLQGIVVGHTQESEFDCAKLKIISRQLDAESLFNPTLWKLLLWSADYYRHPQGEVLHHALPVLLRQGEDRKSVV